ncbi:anti-sigma factor antagonist [Siminovitchia terrae]|uniref:Anti-sigma factor antagonist n=1 Tax=Siminovitchia terrae TaxID=1914933 RepID=A0A429X0S2_SIMTE|nr:anti-sigma factor antagonist [Siminovitchia terrae]RST57056.1 STAS domain-containing protein [Siminovitchia terrae]GIN93465.1 anti-sigma factor antagonist [Siminovitchia terrae]GIN98656.1 anti-sigma factor antagonist [Siminovitchia terrae]
MNVSIEIKEKDNIFYVQLTGEIDAYTAPRVKEKLMEAAKGDSVKLNIDLSNVSYMDSTGLGVFVGVFKQLRANNGYMELTGMTERLQRLFDITGLADVMNINTEVEGRV